MAVHKDCYAPIGLIQQGGPRRRETASFTLFLEDGRVCLSNNAAERGLRGIALGRKSWLFGGSDRGGRRAASMYSLIITAKINGTPVSSGKSDLTEGMIGFQSEGAEIHFRNIKIKQIK